ncbi:hypothetical protein fh0823_20190 [Francisella halioticida]|uniref:Glycosyl transferase n=1 Tax=Francisella halioticida TaxID=549298 RepID=A0ABN5AYF5_9GAMM|nr:glycosyltransferase family 2 protein [Francisella halioticida]ASG68891.1 glycosyl transferase [Francisella halioticida]BCD91880.1 hypothetical protein fh0823_20190 [Francisella halioticida]
MAEINLCVIVPVYKHGKQIYDTIKNISKFNLPIIIIDDGNDKTTKESIKKLDSKFSNIVKTVMLSTNKGKGSAVTIGAKIAFELNYTHILQIDADGQHNFTDIPLFIDKINKYPFDLVSGIPIYDDSIPKSRLHGRKITNFWVAIETWTLQIKEAMCGFRIYPLTPYMQVAKKRGFSKGMGFDIDIIVRMYWAGINIQFIDTKIIYPKNGYSNFRMFKDNVKISWTHTKLVAGMLLRIPILLTRRKFN